MHVPRSGSAAASPAPSSAPSSAPSPLDPDDDLPADAEVDALVVGSGFGAAVAALRLAEAGHSVAVLERGFAYPPGDFPRAPHEFGRNLWDPSEGLLGLFDVWSFRRMDAVVASGLGGGSLVYANVLLELEEEFFTTGAGRDWPVGAGELAPGYRRAREMLGGTPFPYGTAPAPTGPILKVHAMQRAAARLGTTALTPDLAVSFGEGRGRPLPVDPWNVHGIPRRSCTLCGECDVGCNQGSKNSLDHTYLSRAREHGARLLTGHEVRRLDRDGGRWRVGYVRRRRGADDGSGAPTPADPGRTAGSVRARIVVLGAGSLGSTYLLLANRCGLPGLSARLGHGFSGNGDFLGFLTSRDPGFRASRGPVITSAIPVRGPAGDGGPGAEFWVQDGGFPGFLDWIAENALPLRPAARLVRLFASRRWQDLRGVRPAQVSGQLARLLGPGQRAAGILPLLTMGRDTPSGRLGLRDGYLDLDWSPAQSREYFAEVRRTLRRLAVAIDAEYHDSISTFLSRSVTVHPLGGCGMGRDPGTGVVDERGEVFGHPGLFVADGAVLPGPVGPNPSLTIAALAELFSGRMRERLATSPAVAA
ncbi:GMC oxidoreductase [Kineococcus gynurae]|uniref:Cholesterol oxidase n=1 Tax=Kineococcus gynurae TaxID=452979 RepID=A0ABV5LQK0_9ACTN